MVHINQKENCCPLKNMIFFVSNDNYNFSFQKVQLSREVINLSPLSTAIISHRSDDGREYKTGYVRLAAFSQVNTSILYVLVLNFAGEFHGTKKSWNN